MTSSKHFAGSRLRRFAERTFEQQTLERVIFPALADVEFECADDAGTSGLVRLRAYWGLWKAIALCLLTDWARNGRPMVAGVGTRMAIIIPIVMGIVIVPPTLKVSRGPVLMTEFLLTSLPLAFTFAVPIAFFFAVALDRQARSLRRLLPAVFAMSLACTLVTMTVTLSIVPRANQMYRQAVYKQLKAPADHALDSVGSGELTFTELVRRARSQTPERERSAARHALGMRLATATLPIVFGFLALGIAGYPWTQSSFLGMWVLMFYVAGLRAAAVSPFQGPSVRGIWVVNAVFVVVGLSMVWFRPSPADAEPKGYIIS